MANGVLITGAAGFIGRHLGAYMAQQKMEVHGLDKTDVGRPRDWPGLWYGADVTDARQVASVLRTIAPDYVFHLAALLKSDALVNLLAVNVIGTQNVLDAVTAARLGTRVLIPGSSAEYGLFVIYEKWTE